MSAHPPDEISIAQNSAHNTHPSIKPLCMPELEFQAGSSREEKNKAEKQALRHIVRPVKEPRSRKLSLTSKETILVTNDRNRNILN